MIGNERNTSLDSWDGFLGSNFLNAEDVDNEDQAFMCIGTELDAENDRPILILEYNGVRSKFSLNVTNSNFIKNEKVKSPKDVIGKKIYFRKVMVTSPKTKKEVESLRISKVE